MPTFFILKNLKFHEPECSVHAGSGTYCRSVLRMQHQASMGFILCHVASSDPLSCSCQTSTKTMGQVLAERGSAHHESGGATTVLMLTQSNSDRNEAEKVSPAATLRLTKPGSSHTKKRFSPPLNDITLYGVNLGLLQIQMRAVDLTKAYRK